MKRLNLYPYAVLLVLVAVLTACSAPEETSGPPSTAATQQSNSNSMPQSQIAQSNAPGESPVPAPPAINPMPPQPAPAENSAEAKTSKAAKAPDAPGGENARAPKLVIPEKKFEFGKQPQGKTLVRAIVVKNAGRADLKIESVVPSWGCTTVDFPKVLRPGQAGKIKVKVETGNKPGPHTKSVTIKSNDPGDPSHLVQFSFDVKG